MLCLPAKVDSLCGDTREIRHVDNKHSPLVPVHHAADHILIPIRCHHLLLPLPVTALPISQDLQYLKKTRMNVA